MAGAVALVPRSQSVLLPLCFADKVPRSQHGEVRGTTPCTLELSAGTYEVSVNLPGYRAWVASAVSDPQKPEVIRAQLQRIP